MTLNKSIGWAFGVVLVVLGLFGCGSGSNPVPPAATPAPPPPAVSGRPAVPAPAANPPAVPRAPSNVPAVPPVGGLAAPKGQDDKQWTMCDVPGEGFALSIPPGWQQISLSPQDFDALVKAVEAQDPQMAALLKSVRGQVGGNVKFYALELASAATGFATNVNVVVERLPLPMTLDQYVLAALQQIKSLPNAKTASHKPVKTDAGDAEQLNWGMSMRGPTGQTMTSSITQYAFVNGQTGYVVTLTTKEDKASANAETFDRIGRSFRFTK